MARRSQSAASPAPADFPAPTDYYRPIEPGARRAVAAIGEAGQDPVWAFGSLALSARRPTAS